MHLEAILEWAHEYPEMSTVVFFANPSDAGRIRKKGSLPRNGEAGFRIGKNERLICSLLFHRPKSPEREAILSEPLVVGDTANIVYIKHSYQALFYKKNRQ